MWVIIAAIAIGIIGVIAIVYAIKEKSKTAAWAGAFTLLVFAFGLIFGNQLADNISFQPLEAPKDYIPVFASYQEKNGEYEITVRLSFYADTVKVTYSKPQDDVNYHNGSLSLNKTGEKTWIGTLKKNEINANEDSVSVSSEKGNLTIYHTLKLDGSKNLLPAEIDIAVFNPEVNVTETKKGLFCSIKLYCKLYCKHSYETSRGILL